MLRLLKTTENGKEVMALVSSPEEIKHLLDLLHGYLHTSVPDVSQADLLSTYHLARMASGQQSSVFPQTIPYFLSDDNVKILISLILLSLSSRIQDEASALESHDVNYPALIDACLALLPEHLSSFYMEFNNALTNLTLFAKQGNTVPLRTPKGSVDPSDWSQLIQKLDINIDSIPVDSMLVSSIKTNLKTQFAALKSHLVGLPSPITRAALHHAKSLLSELDHAVDRDTNMCTESRKQVYFYANEIRRALNGSELILDPPHLSERNCNILREMERKLNRGFSDDPVVISTLQELIKDLREG